MIPALFGGLKETMEWFLKVINEGPDHEYNQKLKSVSWLSDTLKEEVQPSQNTTGNNGSFDVAALSEAAS